ncbi:MAG: hypothetical protein KAW41_04370 [Candidatus Diapherotrites archaeon]|nr:hypothetical protein [Candidatus Diapherotrites archaeon]
MKRVLLVLLLLCAALAVEVDAETGCETYSDHLVCPQATEIEAEITYTSDVTCYSVQNEFGSLEEIGCFAHAESTGLEYEACSMYIPFDTDIILDEIDYEYQCAIEKVSAGEEITVLAFMDQFTGCETIEETEFYGEYSCPMEGQKRVVNGTIEYYDGDYSILVAGQEAPALVPFADVSSAIVVLAVAVLLVYTLYIWSERKK